MSMIKFECRFLEGKNFHPLMKYFQLFEVKKTGGQQCWVIWLLKDQQCLQTKEQGPDLNHCKEEVMCKVGCMEREGMWTDGQNKMHRTEGLWCSHCKRPRHTRETCFKLHGKEVVLQKLGALRIWPLEIRPIFQSARRAGGKNRDSTRVGAESAESWWNQQACWWS